MPSSRPTSYESLEIITRDNIDRIKRIDSSTIPTTYFTPGNMRYISHTDHSPIVEIYDTLTSTRLYAVKLPSSVTNPIYVNPDGSKLVYQDTIYDCRNNSKAGVIRGFGMASSTCIDSNAKLLVETNFLGTSIRLMDINTQKVIWNKWLGIINRKEHYIPIFSLDSSLFAYIQDDITIINTHSGSVVLNISEHGSHDVVRGEFSYNNKYILLWINRRGLRVFSTTDGSLVASGEGYIRAQISIDDSILFASSEEELLAIDMNTKDFIMRTKIKDSRMWTTSNGKLLVCYNPCSMFFVPSNE